MLTIESFQTLAQTENVTNDTVVGFTNADKTVLQGRTVTEANNKDELAQDAIYLRGQLLKAAQSSGATNLEAIERELFGEKKDGRFDSETAAKPLTMRTVKSVLAQIGKMPEVAPAPQGIDGFEEIEMPKPGVEAGAAKAAFDDFEDLDFAPQGGKNAEPATSYDNNLRAIPQAEPHKSSGIATFGRGIQTILRGIRNIFAKTQTVENAQTKFVAARHAGKAPVTVDLAKIKNPNPIVIDKKVFGKAAGLRGEVILKPFASHDVFGDGPKLTDIKQNPNLQDCWFLSSVASVLSAKGPDYIKSLIEIPDGADHANVKLGGKVFKVPLGEYTDRAGNITTSKSAPWVKLLETAVQMSLIDESCKTGDIRVNMSYRTGSEGLCLLLQQTEIIRPMRGYAGIVEEVRSAINEGRAATLGHTGISLGIAPGHMVSIQGFSDDGSKVHIFDPYGRMIVADVSILKDFPIVIEG